MSTWIKATSKRFFFENDTTSSKEYDQKRYSLHRRRLHIENRKFHASDVWACFWSARKKKCCILGKGCGVVNFKCINSWNCYCKERFNFNEYMWSGNLGLNLQCIRYAFLATLGLFDWVKYSSLLMFPMYCSVHFHIFTFSKQSFIESIDFCNRSYPHKLHKFDWQLPSSLACAIRFEHRSHLPEVTMVLWLTASHTRVAHAKQASCLLHWLSVFTLAVQFNF